MESRLITFPWVFAKEIAMQIRIASLVLYGKRRLRIHVHTICIHVVNKLTINRVPCLAFVVNNAQETRKSQDALEMQNLGKIIADNLLHLRLSQSPSLLQLHPLTSMTLVIFRRIQEYLLHHRLQR